MDRYVTGAVIRKLREDKKMTQDELAERIHVSSKTISKWETAKGLPDISLLQPLSDALGLSVIELFSGSNVQNRNRSANMAKTVFYVCPVCGNAIRTIGEAVISCCGISLPPLQAEEPDEEHTIRKEIVEDEYYVTVSHPMQKDHFISWLAAVSDQGIEFVKTFPEGDAEARFQISRVQYLYAYCNRHGLFRLKI